MNKLFFLRLQTAYWLILLVTVDGISQSRLPNGFVDLSDQIPALICDLRYYSENNFMGTVADGYHAQKCIISVEAARALVSVQVALRKEALQLMIFDAYRPQRAVNHFVRWAKDSRDTTMKFHYYPEVRKSELFKLGYIASKSGHTRGSTVDLTVADLMGNELDMCTSCDFFSQKSWPSNKEISIGAQANRGLLRKIMIQNGFVPYEAEWWHFTLVNEPFPDTYFDFVIE